MRLLYAYYIYEIDLIVDNICVIFRQLVMLAHLHRYVHNLYLRTSCSSLSSRKCAFEYFLKKLEQMYLARPTEDLVIDSILV